MHLISSKSLTDITIYFISILFVILHLQIIHIGFILNK